MARHRVRLRHHRVQVQRMHLRRPVREEGDLAAFMEHRAPRQLGRQRQPQLATVEKIQAQRRIALALCCLQAFHVLQCHGPAVYAPHLHHRLVVGPHAAHQVLGQDQVAVRRGQRARHGHQHRIHRLAGIGRQPVARVAHPVEVRPRRAELRGQLAARCYRDACRARCARRLGAAGQLVRADGEITRGGDTAIHQRLPATAAGGEGGEGGGQGQAQQGAARGHAGPGRGGAVALVLCHRCGLRGGG